MIYVLAIIGFAGMHTWISIVITGLSCLGISHFFPQYEELIAKLQILFPRVVRFWEYLHRNPEPDGSEPLVTLPIILLFSDLWPVWIPIFFMWLAYHTFMRWRVGRDELARRLAEQQKKAEIKERIRAQESASMKALREIAKIELRENQLQRELAELRAAKYEARLRIAPDTYREASIAELAEDEATEGVCQSRQ